jgi:hypothetical protein
MKKQKKQHTLSKKSSIVLVVLLVVVAATAIVVTQKIRDYNAATDQANIVEIRELIVLAIRGVKKDAPVDPKTGDVYFPEAKLYLPNPHTALALTYLEDTGNIADAQSSLTVSTYPVLGTTNLYTAQDTNQLFAAVPKLQACSRGIKLVYQQFPATDNTNVLRHTVHLNNGKTMYVYVEKDCPDLNSTADLFTGVRAY